MMNHIRPWTAAGSILVVSLAGCATGGPVGQVVGPGPQLPDPIIVADATVDTVLYLGVDLTPMLGTIGSHYDGLLKVRQGANSLTGELQGTWQEWMSTTGGRLLEEAGYPVRQISRMFGAVESFDGVGLALAGEVVDLRLDTYGSLAGNQTEAGVAIRWEVLDVRSRRVIFSRRTSAQTTTSGMSGDAFLLAFRSSLAQLLSDPALAGTLQGVSAPSRVAESEPEKGPFRRRIPAPSDLISLSIDDQVVATGETAYNIVAPGVVALRGDGTLGTAFLITSDGLALTNHHVIDGARGLRAIFQDRTERAVRVIRSDSSTDVALIEIACEEDCFTAPLGSSGNLEAGADLVVIGTPLSEALSHTITRGILSGKRLTAGVTLLQTDAALNPGNSGGPIVDPVDNTVVGIATRKLDGDGLEGLGFAVAIEDALRVLGISAPR